MKKRLAVAVSFVVAFAFAAYAGDETLKVKTKTVGDTTTTVVKENAPGEKIKEKIKETPTEVTAKEVIKTPGEKEVVKVDATKTSVAVTDTEKLKKGIGTREGLLHKETVKLNENFAGGDYIYVIKDNKTYRLKHTFNESTKKDMLKKKKGDTITITSTIPLTAPNAEAMTIVQSAK